MDQEMLHEEILTRDTPWQGHIMAVEEITVRLSNGETAPREVVRHPGAVCVIPLCEDGTVLVERQWRTGYGGVTLEIPAGKLNTRTEDARLAAERELSEETGAVAAHWLYLGEYWGSPAILDEKIEMYAAWGLTFGDTHPDADEFLSVERIPLDTLIEMILRGEVPDGKTEVAALRLKAMLDRGMIR